MKGKVIEHLKYGVQLIKESGPLYPRHKRFTLSKKEVDITPVGTFTTTREKTFLTQKEAHAGLTGFVGAK